MSRESRLVKRENSMNHGSSRSVYYGVAAVAVPFLWESVPGTPKKTAGDASLLPPLLLSPPPGSHCLSSPGRSERKSPKRFVRCVALKLLRGSKLSSWLPILFPMASSPLNAAGDVSLPSALCFRVRRGTNDKIN
ncbi:uncharacterized protein LOC121999685 [Zingiber officinale]|uniref:uncharacterized protein LOC121999685 n=1 Tax=Zingiber officinale TaxID=94328 RepID=UPI001C4BBF59|nr:uncharacterized protein LOC121999685 [Zingiber officinale]